MQKLSKRIVIGLFAGTLLTLATTTQAADRYTIDSAHTLVSFQLSHLGFSTSIGWIGDVSGEVMFDADDKTKSSVGATLAVSSINTNHEHRDGWIKSDKLLNATVNPSITFESTLIEEIGDNIGKIVGDLTMNGTTKPVVLEAVFNKAGQNPLSKKDTIGVSAKTVIRRSDWGVSAFLGPLGDEITIQIELEAIKAE